MKPPERANIEEKKEEIKEPEQCHLESALAKCGDNCMQEFEDVYNIWDWHKGWGPERQNHFILFMILMHFRPWFLVEILQ